MKNRIINKENWTAEAIAWLAGLVEGEGYIAKGKVFLRVRMSDWDVVQRCEQLFGIGNLRGPVEGNKKKKHKPMYEWTITRKQDFQEILLAIYPKLGFRRKKRICDCFKRLGMAIPDQEQQLQIPRKSPVFGKKHRQKTVDCPERE